MGRRSVISSPGAAIVERPESQTGTNHGLSLKLDSPRSSTDSRHDPAADGSKAQRRGTT